MKIELQNKLFKKYPKIFSQKDLSIEESCMPFGIECGNGWYWLIDQLCDSIQGYIDPNNINQIEVVQVKEKFGTLSFYTSGADEMMRGMVWLAENMSADICETCGSTKDVTQTKGWIRTICKECLENEK